MTHATKPEVHLLTTTALDTEGLNQYLEIIGAAGWESDAESDIEEIVEIMGRGCFDSDTEILTDCGWKRGLELDGSERVLTWNHNKQFAEFQNYDPVVYDYNGQMLRIKQQHIDLLVTSDHRLYVQENH